MLAVHEHHVINDPLILTHALRSARTLPVLSLLLSQSLTNHGDQFEVAAQNCDGMQFQRARALSNCDYDLHRFGAGLPPSVMQS